MTTARRRRRCQCTDRTSDAVVSRHPTSEGMIVYTRCDCGHVHVLRVRHDAADEVLATDRARPLELVAAVGGAAHG